MPARMYEVILPKKLGYFGKVQEVLEDLFDEQAIRAVPFIQQSIEQRRRQSGEFDEEAWIKTLCQASRGYSIYEMDGRYLSPRGPGRRAGAGDPVHLSQSERPGRLAHRFPGRRRSKSSTTWWPTGSPNELGVEEEIWFLEYHQPQLAIWRKGPAEAAAERASRRRRPAI